MPMPVANLPAPLKGVLATLDPANLDALRPLYADDMTSCGDTVAVE